MAKRRKSRTIRQSAASRRLVDPGADVSGRFDVSPFAARGHVVEVAPKELRSSPETSFPKRIATQRMIDRYHRRGLITDKHFAAACRLWSLFHAAGWNPRITSGYHGKVDNETTHGAQLSHRIEAGDEYIRALRAVPYRSKGVVVHVVIIDSSAGDWATMRGISARDSGRRGLIRLRAGLSALVDYLRY